MAHTWTLCCVCAFFGQDLEALVKHQQDELRRRFESHRCWWKRVAIFNLRHPSSTIQLNPFTVAATREASKQSQDSPKSLPKMKQDSRIKHHEGYPCPKIHGVQAKKTAMVSEKKTRAMWKKPLPHGKKSRFVAGIGSWIWLARWVSFFVQKSIKLQ